MRLLTSAMALSLTGAAAYLLLTSHPSLADSMVDTADRTEVVASPAAAEPIRDAPPRRVMNPVQTTAQTQMYAVEGSTAEEILQSLVSTGPQTDGEVFFGLTTAEMDLRFNRVAFGGACEIRVARITLDLTVTLPEWDAPREAAPALRRDWWRFRNALRRHEDEHRRIAERGANALYRAVEGLRRPTCEQAEADGNQRVEQLQIEIEAAHRRFDDQTGHGRTQGAVWPL